MGADGVELDVHLCASGEPVVLHDDTLERTTSGKGRISDITLPELRQLRTANGETVPTLEEALALLGNAYCFVEIKHEDAALPAAAIIDAQVKKGAPAGKLWLISFRHAALKAALKAYPDLSAGASFETLALPAIHEAHGWGARAILPHHESFGPAEVKAAHALGMKFICWTVNDAGHVMHLKAMGVDGIMGDYPDRL